MKYRTPLIATVIPLCAGLALAAGAGYAGASQTHRTTFAFGSSGYGTRVNGGQLPASSDTTAYQVVGCTNRAGLHRTNDVADATVPGLGTLSGVRTRVWTHPAPRRGRLALDPPDRRAQSRLVRARVADPEGDHVPLDGVPRRPGLSHHHLHSHRRHQVHPAGRPGPVVPGADARPTRQVPGLATISIGRHHGVHDARNASADAFALRSTWSRRAPRSKWRTRTPSCTPA